MSHDDVTCGSDRPIGKERKCVHLCDVQECIGVHCLQNKMLYSSRSIQLVLMLLFKFSISLD